MSAFIPWKSEKLRMTVAEFLFYMHACYIRNRKHVLCCIAQTIEIFKIWNAAKRKLLGPISKETKGLGFCEGVSKFKSTVKLCYVRNLKLLPFDKDSNYRSPAEATYAQCIIARTDFKPVDVHKFPQVYAKTQNEKTEKRKAYR